MAKKFRLIPFGLWPANWGLEGKRRQEAKLEYYWEGEDLAHLKNELENGRGTKNYEHQKNYIARLYDHITEEEYERKSVAITYDAKSLEYHREMLRLDSEYRKITLEEYDRAILKLDHEPNTIEYKLASLKLDKKWHHISEEEYQEREDMLKLDFYYPTDNEERRRAVADLDLKYNRINEQQHRKIIATLDKEPWFEFIDAKYKPSGAEQGTFSLEFDWNDYFVDELIEAGWTGISKDEVVDKWFRHTMYEISGGADIEEEDILPPIVVPPRATRNIVNPGEQEYS